MMRLQAWIDSHRDDPRALTPRCVEQLAARRGFSESYGRRAAERYLREANEARDANTRRARAVLVGMAAIREKIDTDPGYTARQAARDAEILRSEYERLRSELPRLALKVEDARAISADPVSWAEAHLEKFPALADRLPGLPPF